MFALGCSVAFSQSIRDIVKDNLPAFSGISLGGDFKLELRSGSEYTATLTTEDLLAEYVQFSVSNDKLAVSLDDRKVPAEVRRLFRGKDAAATLRLVVTMPDNLRSLSLSGRAALVTAEEGVASPEGVEITLKDNARIGAFAFSTSRLSVRMERKADATLDATCDSLDVQMSGSSNLSLTQHVEGAGYVLGYNANLVVSGEADRLYINTKGTSKAILNGKAPVAVYKVTNASNVNAVNLEAEEARVEMSGLCTLTQAASRDLFVNIGSGSTLVFQNEPSFHILNVKGASITPYDKKK